MHDVLNLWLNPVTWAVPFFLRFIGIELAALKWLNHDDGVTGYSVSGDAHLVVLGARHRRRRSRLLLAAPLRAPGPRGLDRAPGAPLLGVHELRDRAAAEVESDRGLIAGARQLCPAGVRWAVPADY